MLMLVALIEFAFAFNALLAGDYASRDAALVAAEAGNGTGADCAVLKAVESDYRAPTNAAQIQKVEIYKATAAGAQSGGATAYNRTGSLTCTLPDGTSVTLPYSIATDGYPMANRCNLIAGCSGQPLDFVGVRVTYRHTWKTAFGSTFGPYLTVVKANSMRMEPVL